MKKILTIFMLLCNVALAKASVVNKIELGKPILSKEIFGASGLVSADGDYLVISDDMPWLFRVDEELDFINKKPLLEVGRFTLNKGRIEGSNRPDYEAISKVQFASQEYSIILGSGGKELIREFGHMVNMSGSKQYTRYTTSLYKQLKQAAGYEDGQRLNIEGLITTGETAYIFHRGNFTGRSIIFMIPEKELVAYMMKKKNSVSSIGLTDVVLPSINGTQAGLSGGDYSVSNRSLVFSASVETSGGKVEGSFLGVVPVDKIKPDETIDLRAFVKRLAGSDQFKPIKVESVAVRTDEPGRIYCMLATDNNGSSYFFKTLLLFDF